MAVKSRRGSGEGSIYQIKDGRWVSTINLGLTDDGRRRRKSFYGHTRQEVRTKLLKAQRENDERRIATASPTLSVWLDYWLDDIATVRASTRQSYTSNIKNHLKPTLGHRRLDRIETSHVRALYAKMRRDGLSDSTISQCHAILRRALLVAMREGKVSTNVADKTHMQPPKGGDNPRTPLTLQQAHTVLAAAKDDPYESRWYAALYLGLRQGEALGLRWSDVDLADGTITVARALQRVRNGGFTYVEPKSRHSHRVIPLPTVVASRLAVYRARHNAVGGTPDDLVWSLGGAPIGAQRDSTNWRRLLERAGVPHVPLHAARNTAGSLLMASGAPTSSPPSY